MEGNGNTFGLSHWNRAMMEIEKKVDSIYRRANNRTQIRLLDLNWYWLHVDPSRCKSLADYEKKGS